MAQLCTVLLVSESCKESRLNTWLKLDADERVTLHVCVWLVF